MPNHPRRTVAEHIHWWSDPNHVGCVLCAPTVAARREAALAGIRRLALASTLAHNATGLH